MREIKFRAWDKEKKRFWNDDIEDDYFHIRLDGSIDLLMSDDGGKNGLHEHSVDFSKDRFILQQFTGLKDKNGKEIHEGDIIKLSEAGETGKVIWNTEEAGFIGQRVDKDFGIFGFLLMKGMHEVIGNIHENPELLRT